MLHHPAQALSKQGCAVDFVGGSSSVLVVGGRSLPTSAGAGGGASNLSVWDTMAPTASSCVGRLVNHQARWLGWRAMLLPARVPPLAPLPTLLPSRCVCSAP